MSVFHDLQTHLSRIRDLTGEYDRTSTITSSGRITLEIRVILECCDIAGELKPRVFGGTRVFGLSVPTFYIRSRFFFWGIS